ncbi:syntaxin-7 isoform X2 [Zootermopsis nevadensis]|uniref:Syntaxin-12 n=1 Tax=Zootermopsis nevadensis TaxID=136037 RepID=A0A067QSR3_ZOONE|nr:syntaxin-7 isoform X2 [Zootermopsis nevadensis]KDR12892.1 Syntaxin-12 [Zootermopsis nevadensis]
MEGNYSFSSYHNGGPGREKDFQKLAQTIGTSIQKISQNVSSMQKMVNQLGTPQDSQELRNQLHQIQHYTQQLAKDTSANLKELTGLPLPSYASEQVHEPLLKKRDSEDDRQWKMQKDRLADEFTTALNMFQATQRRAAQKEKEQIQRVRANSGLGDPFGGSRYSEQLIELQDNGRQQDVQVMDEMNLQLLEEQEQAIRQLESDISDVNQIFKELGAMVHEQGEVIDSIEASVEKTEVFVGEGASQLRQASNYQTKLRKKKCILAICLTVLLAVIIGIIIWQVSD